MTEQTDWADLDEGLDLDDFEAKTGGFVNLTEGIYKADLTDVYPKVSKEKKDKFIVFEYTVTEGEFEGVKYNEWKKFDEKGKPYIKGRYVSLGCSDEPGTRYAKDDVVGVSVILELRKNGDYVNVKDVTLDTGNAAPKAEKKSEPKKSGGNLFS